MSGTQYHTGYHPSIDVTPFQSLYGRLPLAISLYQVGTSLVNEVDKNLVVRDNRMKQMVDRGRRDVEFQEGDMVILKLHPYRQQTFFRGAHQKLANRFYGPYMVAKKVGVVAYHLQLPEGARVHPVFHVSLLKKKIGEGYVASRELPPITDDGEIMVKSKKILET